MDNGPEHKAGKGDKQHTKGSSEIIRTVLSTKPTARNRERCSPGGTFARLMHTTSADISFLSVYSFSWPDCKVKEFNYQCEVRNVTVTNRKGFVSAGIPGPSQSTPALLQSRQWPPAAGSQHSAQLSFFLESSTHSHAYLLGYGEYHLGRPEKRMEGNTDKVKRQIK